MSDVAHADLDDLIACPACDALYRRANLSVGERARCLRCGALIHTRKNFVLQRMLASALSMGLLLLAAVSFPFVSLEKAGITSSASVIEAVAALSGEGPWIAAAALAFVVGIPLLRALAQIYVLLPLVVRGRCAPGAARMHRMVITLRPWAMAEVFTIGVLVAMVKLGALADVVVGPAFVALLALVFVAAFESLATCETTLWTRLESS